MTNVQSIPIEQEVFRPEIRKIGVADLAAVLREGTRDFMEMPTHYAFLCFAYPLMGLIIGVWTTSQDLLPLLFPLVAGFALVGPLAALGLYEISRRRELGLDATWVHAFDVLRSPALPSIMTLGLLLMLILFAWLYVAEALYLWLYGTMTVPGSYGQFLSGLLTTSQGWTLIGVGNLIGFVFALVTLSITVVSFPLLLDRNVGVAEAMGTSIRVMKHNPGPILLWGFLVAALLFLASLPLLIGLPLVLPVLGHATWHLYRRTVKLP